MPTLDDEEKIITIRRMSEIFGGLSILTILAGIGLIVASAFTVISLPLIWPILILVVGLVGIIAAVVVSKSANKPSIQEDSSSTLSSLPEIPAHRADNSVMQLQVLENATVNNTPPKFVRYQQAFPTVEEVKEAVEAGAEIPYFSDHLPILFEDNGIKILSYNVLASDGGNGFAYADNGRHIANGEVGEIPEQTIARNKKNLQLINEIGEKHQPQIICLQECNIPKEDESDGSKIKFDVGRNYDPVLVDLPKNYQFKGVSSYHQSYNSSKFDFNLTVTLFSDNFLNDYDVELDTDLCTWKCTNKNNKSNVIKVFNGHIYHQDVFGLTEARIKRQLVNSLSDNHSTSQVTSYNVGDFNNRVAPVNNSEPQNLTECVRAACCTEKKVQSCASGSGAYKATGIKYTPQFAQLKGTFINPHTAELMPNIPPLDTNSMPPWQQEEVNKIEPVMCIDDYYRSTPMIGDLTIFEYEHNLREQLGMHTLLNDAPFSVEFLNGEKIKSIVILENNESIPDEQKEKADTIYFKKDTKGKIMPRAQWFKNEKLLESWVDEDKKSNLETLLSPIETKIKKDNNPVLFSQILSLCKYAFKESEAYIAAYDKAVRDLLFLRVGATINNERYLTVIFPTTENSVKFFNGLDAALSGEKTIKFDSINTWFQSNHPRLINYQISIPLDKVEVFDAAVKEYFNSLQNQPSSASSSTSSFTSPNLQ